MIVSDDEKLGQIVREEIARRRISRQALAEMAKISLSTLEKGLAGTRPFTLATIIRIEDALGKRLRSNEAPQSSGETQNLAPLHLGSYSRAGIKWIEGRYLTLRPSFKNSGDIFSYVTSIEWSDDAGHLVFSESQRTDSKFEQIGVVSLPNLSGHIYLVTNDEGQHRMMVLGRPTIEGRLYGLLTTLQVGNGSQLIPVSCPVALLKWDEAVNPVIGSVTHGTEQHKNYRDIIDAATAGDYLRYFA